MKRVFVALSVVLLITMLLLTLTQCVPAGKSLNVKIMESTSSTVRFRPVCPECNAVGESQWVTLYVGEGDIFTDVAMCDECWYVFDIGITRD